MFLTPSAAGWSRPAQPTRLGPRRFCIQALTFRSISVSSATPIMMTVNTRSILMTLSRMKPFISGVIEALRRPRRPGQSTTAPVR